MEWLRKNWFLWLFGIAYIATHLITLEISPLPWYDETYMASISQTYLEEGRLFAQVAWAHQTEYPPVYGPVFFVIASGYLKVLGFGIWQYRLVVISAGLLVIWLSYRLFKQSHLGSKFHILFVIALSLDPFFCRSMHEGRMDLWALLFLLISSYQLISYSKNHSWKPILLSSFWLGTAMLTTPRSAFFGVTLAFFGCIILWRVLTKLEIVKSEDKRKILWQALSWAVIPTLMYSVWVVKIYGGYTEMIDFFTREGYWGFTRLNTAKTSILAQQYPMMAVAILSIVFGYYRLGNRLFSALFILGLLSISLFYLLVFDQGPYAVFVIPSYYLVIFSSLERAISSLPNVIKLN